MVEGRTASWWLRGCVAVVGFKIWWRGGEASWTAARLGAGGGAAAKGGSCRVGTERERRAMRDIIGWLGGGRDIIQC